MRSRLILTVAIVAAFILTAAVLTAGAQTVPVEEADLTGWSAVYEVNLGSDGLLYLSDYDSWEIWRVDPDPDTSEYTTYSLLGVSEGVVDARPDDAGDIWWTDYANSFGVVDVQSNEVTAWTLSEGINLGGLTFDAAGKLWTTEWLGDELYRFDPASRQLCTYTLPGGASSYYVLYLYDGGLLWLGNWGADRIVSFDPGTDGVTWWQLQGGSTPNGLAVDGDGALWWADNTLGVLAQLEPELDQSTTYTLPLGTAPQMIATAGGKVWYTESVSGTVGTLDPETATGSTTILSTGSGTAAVVCTTLGVGTTSSLTPVSGVLSWVDNSWTTEVDANGWTVYQLPANSSPYGIAITISPSYVWVTDQGNQKLVRLAISVEWEYESYVPLVLKNMQP